VAGYYVKSGVASLWATAQVVVSGDRRVPREAYATPLAKGYVFECTTGGTTDAATEPTWPTTPGNTVNDNGVIWTCRDPITWANALAFVHYWLVSARAASGDVLYVASVHSEAPAAVSSGGFLFTVGEGTLSILSVDSAGSPEPPTTLLAGAIVAPTGSNGITWLGLGSQSVVYIYGIYFVTNNVLVELGSGWAMLALEDCKFTINGGGGNTGFTLNSRYLRVRNPVFKFSAPSQYVTHYQLDAGGDSEWVNVSIDGAGTLPTNIFQSVFGRRHTVSRQEVTASDFSNLAAGKSVFSANNSYLAAGYMVLMNSSLNVNANLNDAALTVPIGLRVEGYVYGSSLDLLKYRSEVYGGTFTLDTATYFTSGGASLQGTKYSQKLVTNAEPALGKIFPARSKWLQVWNEITGVPRTLTLEFLHDSVTNLKDNEVWIEYEYYGSGSSCKSTWVSTVASILAAGANLAAGAGAGSWTKSMTNPNSQKIAVTFTPQSVGMIRARVCFAKASYTLYFDPQARLV
jgi:hypothetical protein